MGYVGSVDTSVNKSELISNMRDIKLRIIEGDDIFKINSDLVESNTVILDFLSKNFPNAIITGSFALTLYGLINRTIKDIDLLIDESEVGDSKSYYKEIYGYGNTNRDFDNRLGFKTFYYKPGFFMYKRRYTLDFFVNNENSTYITFNHKGVNLKLHNPIEIMKDKIMMGSSKHLRDCQSIMEKLK